MDAFGIFVQLLQWYLNSELSSFFVYLVVSSNPLPKPKVDRIYVNQNIFYLTESNILTRTHAKMYSFNFKLLWKIVCCVYMYIMYKKCIHYEILCKIKVSLFCWKSFNSDFIYFVKVGLFRYFIYSMSWVYIIIIYLNPSHKLMTHVALRIYY